MKSQKKAYLFALTAICFWSTIGSAFKIILRYLDPLGLLFLSSFVACLVLFSIMLIQGKLILLKYLTLKEILLSAFLGFLNPFLYYVVLLHSYDILQAQEAGTLNYIWPLILVLLSIPMLKQKISLGSILAIAISFIGIVIISTHPEIGQPLMQINSKKLVGISLAVGSAVFWALYWIFNIKDNREAVSKIFLNFCFGCLYTFIAIILFGRFPLSNWQGYTGAIYIGLFEMGITFVLWLNALKFSATTAKVSNLIYLSPFISLMIIHLAVGEPILASTIAGLILIVSGIILQQYLRR